MAYRAFSLKYRPCDFDEVVGQEQVIATLKSAILNNRVHHAYLFSGPRGVGKTTVARILAKALTCKEGITVKPCNQCISCVEITKGISLDVIEIDGASNRGIDEVRALRESTKLSPTHSRFKIYIIDEVHMLTQEAFNALLKTLEEPPQHVKFIFATTHPHKVIPTILSRCQKFQFQLLPTEKIMDKLLRIKEAEDLDIPEETLYAIAKAGAGSIRDAESLLDQVAPIIISKMDVGEVLSFLGIISEDELNRVTKFIVSGDTQAILRYIQKVAQEGKDLGVFLNSLIEHFRNLLLAKVSIDTLNSLKGLSPNTKDFLVELSLSINISDLLLIIDYLIEAKDLARKLNSVRVPLELAVIRFTYKKEEINPLRRKKILKERNNQMSHQKDPSKSTEVTSNPKEKLKDINLDDIFIEDKTANENNTKIPSKGNFLKEEYDNNASVNQNSSLTLQDILNKWPQIITDISKRRVSLASYLGEAELKAFDGNTLYLVFIKAHRFHKEIVEIPKNIEFIRQYIKKYLDINDTFKIKCSLKEEEETKVKVDDKINGEETEFINELLDSFEGKLHTDNE